MEQRRPLDGRIPANAMCRSPLEAPINLQVVSPSAIWQSGQWPFSSAIGKAGQQQFSGSAVLQTLGLVTWDVQQSPAAQQRAGAEKD